MGRIYGLFYVSWRERGEHLPLLSAFSFLLSLKVADDATEYHGVY